MKKYNNICAVCWKNKRFCNCLNQKIIKIDQNISFIICNLNKHNFLTKFCCGGHVEKGFSFIYIHFKKNYIFDVLPENFIYNDNTLYYRNLKSKTKEDIQNNINIHIKILKEWVNKI